MAKDDTKKRRLPFTPHLLITLAALCVIALLVFPLFTHFRRQAEARTVLNQAKNVELALRLLGLESYGENSPLTDHTRLSGLTSQTERELAELTGCEGQLYLLSWDSDAHRPAEFLYREGEYLVTFEREGEESLSWEVNRLQKMKAGGQTEE